MSLSQFIRRTPLARMALAAPIAMRRAWMDYRRQPSLDLLARIEMLVTSDIQVSVTEFEGEFLLGPRSHLLHRILAEGEYEPELVKLFLSHVRPDRDVIDVGANVGFFTVLAARHIVGGRILAAEPTRAAFGRLERNLLINGVADKVIAYNGLVSDSVSELSVNVVPGREEYSSMGTVVHPSVAGQPIIQELITAKPLDLLVKEHELKPGLIKVDVEGAEACVFAGAEETLKTWRPVVISEFSRPLLEMNGSSPEAVLALFDRCGYDVRDPHDPHVRPGSLEFGDIIATPRQSN